LSGIEPGCAEKICKSKGLMARNSLYIRDPDSSVASLIFPNMKSFLLNNLLPSLLLVLAATTITLAQPGSTGPEPGTTPPDPTGVPIDGGVSLLLAGGVAYGVKHLRDRRRKA
jgi:hypothetical protein